MIIMTDEVTNIYSLLGIMVGAVSGILIAIINSNKKVKQANRETIKELKSTINELEDKLDRIKTTSKLVFNEMERNDTLSDQLRDFKKMFDL